MQWTLYCLVHNIEKPLLGSESNLNLTPTLSCSGRCTAWFTTSRNWRIMDTADRKAAATMTLPDAGENHEHDVFGSAYAIT